MSKIVPKKLTVCVDSREKYPLFFPKAIKYHPTRGGDAILIPLKVKVVKLETADYLLEGYENVCIIERKGAMRELLGNLFTADHRRSEAAFARLAEGCQYPYLLLDFPLTEIFTVTDYVPDPTRVFDALLDTVQRFRLGLLWPGLCKTVQSRTRLGELCVRLMLSYALRPATPEPVDVLKILDSIVTPEKKP